MASYYEQVQAAITANEKELAHLKDELRGLRSVEKDTPRESFQRQHAQILYHIDQEQQKLEKNRALLDSFHTARDAISELRVSRENEELDKLRALLDSERDPKIRREILEELEAKELEHQTRIETIEETVRTNMANLTDELRDELRQSFLALNEEEKKEVVEPEVVVAEENAEVTENVEKRGETGDSDEGATGGNNENPENNKGENEAAVTATQGTRASADGNETETEIEVEIELPGLYDQRRLQLQSNLDSASDELAEAEQELQESIQRFKKIFAEERTRMENEGPFRTEAELDDFLSEYMRQKIEENERFEAAKDRVAKAKRQVSRIETRIAEQAKLQEQARGYEIDAEVLEQIKEAVSKKEVLDAVYAQKGLGEVTRSTKEGREQADKVTAEIVEGILQQLREAGINTGSITQEDLVQSGILNVNQNGAVNINIIDNVNLIVGSNMPMHEGPARTISIPAEEIDRIKLTQGIKIKVKIIPHNGNEQDGKTPGKAPEDMIGAETTTGVELTAERGKVKTKTKGQINAAMERISKTLWEREAALDEAKRNLAAAKEANRSAEEIAALESAVATAQGAFDEQMEKLRSKQKEYIEVTEDGKYDAVGTERRMKLINGEYIADEQSVAGDVTTLRVAGGKDDGRPAFTDASAKKEGQIDRATFEKLLRQRDREQGIVPTPTRTKPDPTSSTPTPSKSDPTPSPTVTKTEVTQTVTVTSIQVLYGPPPVITPTRVEPTPTQETPEPTKATPSPTKATPSPTKATPSPTMATPSPTKEQQQRGLMTIMEELTKGLGLKAKDGKRYKASNIKVFKGFKEELCSGNFLYNIVHLVPAIVKLPFNLIRKAAGKIMMRAESKRNIAELKKRLDKLSDEDLMTIYTEYRGNKVLQERFPTILNTLVEERIQRFALGKVTEINGELEVRYQAAFSAMHQLDAINAELAQEGLSDARRRELQAAKRDVLSGQAENIATIRSRYIEANNWMSGGLHGFSEDMKAAATKLSLVGKRFAKDHDLNPELLERQAALERAEMQAIADGNDEMALRVFVENELLLSKNTKIQGSIFGRRSTGEKYYSPLVEQLDYRDDPFIRDLFTTIAVTSATISTIQSIKAARDQAAIIAENNRRMAQNNQTMQQVNQMGADIAGKRGTMMEGMESQGMQDTLTSANEIERAVLDKTDWGLGTRAYRTADNAGHSYYTTFYDSTKQAYENIAQQYASGQISQAQAMQQMADLGARTHQTFGAINTECLNILKPYAATHSFDLSGVQGAMEYLQANPSAVQAMNQAMVDVTNAGDILASMSLQQLIPLTTLPANIRTVIINGAATAALASNINNSMGARKHTYGNSVTDMVDEYQGQRTAEGEARGNTSNR
jgi:hypothetical protein